MYSIAIDGPAGADRKEIGVYLCGYGSHVPGYGALFYTPSHR